MFECGRRVLEHLRQTIVEATLVFLAARKWELAILRVFTCSARGHQFGFLSRCWFRIALELRLHPFHLMTRLVIDSDCVKIQLEYLRINKILADLTSKLSQFAYL